VAVRYALGAPLRPLVVTNIYNDPVETVKHFAEQVVEVFLLFPTFPSVLNDFCLIFSLQPFETKFQSFKAVLQTSRSETHQFVTF
jgi:hypothetical protein